MKDLRFVLIVILTIIIYVVFAFAPSQVLFDALASPYLRVLFIVIGGTLAFGYILILFGRYTNKQLETSRKLKHYELLLAKDTHTFSVLEARKGVEILDAQGGSVIEYSYRCKNTLDKELECIRHDITHDGTLVEGSLKCAVNDKAVAPTEIERLLLVDPKTREPVTPRPNIFKFKIPCEPKIGLGEVFKYQYSYQAKRVFPQVTEKGAESSGTLIMHPTDRLTYIIKAPEGYDFDPRIKIEVLDRYGLEHVSEAHRMQEECPPELADKGRIWLWVIEAPMIADIYRIYFSIKKMK